MQHFDNSFFHNNFPPSNSYLSVSLLYHISMNFSTDLAFLCFLRRNFRGLTALASPLLLSVLRRLFHLGDFGFHGFYQLCELFFAFLSCLCVDILGDAFAVDSWCEPTFLEVVVYHGNASHATLANLTLVWLKFLLGHGVDRENESSQPHIWALKNLQKTHS